METVCSPTSAALACSFDNLIKSHPYTLVRFNPPRASLHPIIRQQSPNTFYSIVRHPKFTIICIGSESCLWLIVGLPGSCAYYLTFRYIDHGSKGRTTAICVLVYPDEYLSRESQKLTVMMRREPVSSSEVSNL